MATGREDRHHGGRTKWTDKMCIDLISCREQASNIYSTDECPRKENGKKVGIMELTKRFWDSMGYSQLSKTSQNLADKYRHLQKTANIPSLLIQAEIRSQHSRQNETTPTADNNIVNTHETEVEREDSTSSIDNYDFVNGLLKLEIATEPWITIYNSVLETFHSIKSQPGNFEIRTENSFVKKKPSVKESKELDQIAVNFFFFFFFFFWIIVTSPEGPLHNTIIFTTVLEMLFTISTVTRETNAILHKIRLGFEQLAPALHT